jgi:uncharacterized membrane protein YcaP (DUF421 family)
MGEELVLFRRNVSELAMKEFVSGLGLAEKISSVIITGTVTGFRYLILFICLLHT